MTNAKTNTKTTKTIKKTGKEVKPTATVKRIIDRKLNKDEDKIIVNAKMVDGTTKTYNVPIATALYTGSPTELVTNCSTMLKLYHDNKAGFDRLVSFSNGVTDLNKSERYNKVFSIYNQLNKELKQICKAQKYVGLSGGVSMWVLGLGRADMDKARKMISEFNFSTENDLKNASCYGISHQKVTSSDGKTIKTVFNTQSIKARKIVTPTKVTKSSKIKSNIKKPTSQKATITGLKSQEVKKTKDHLTYAAASVLSN